MALAGVKEALQSKEASRSRRSSGGSSSNRTWLRLKDGDSVRVRFLEQDDDFKTAWTHTTERVGTRKDGSTYTTYDERLAQGPDDLNERGEKPRFKFWINVIWRDGPVFARDEEGRIIREGKNPKVDHTEDVLAVFSGGITLAEELDFLNGKYKGLTSRDFIISRTGATKDDTKYKIEPVSEEDEEGNTVVKRQPMSAADKELAEQKEDLDGLIAELRDNATTFVPPRSTEESADERSEDNPFRRARS